ncbi:hypothetical protein [Tropicimonas aquimaris]|uniref:HEPN AbiU2-like domain-containing protein n=1 Tax=Tropicimonas aquimaris TaxID=914152 RepID=A0ABW3IS92_9RHOB
MLRINAHYLYELGHRIHGVTEINIFPGPNEHLHTCSEALGYLYPAHFALRDFMTASVFQIRTLFNPARAFQDDLQIAIEHCRRDGAGSDLPTTDLIFKLQESHREFEAVLKAELSNANIFLALPKAAFDTYALTEAGHRAFSPDISTKIPEVIPDLDFAMKCIAFDLPTAAAFHLHRALEIIIGNYWDHVSDGKDRPKNQTLGSYIHHLEQRIDKNEALIASLRDIKNLHRNPTIHADQTLESTEEAIDLQGGIRAATTIMLREIPNKA